jgi:hypothetical protein
MITLEHIDPIKGVLVSGLCNEFNEIFAEESYNKRKNNRFVPYRQRDYPAPFTFGDIGEFLIGADFETDSPGDWVITEFGGELWWSESNRVGNAHVFAGRIGNRNQPLESKQLGGRRGTEAIRENGTGIYALTLEERSENGRLGGKTAKDRKVGIHAPGVVTSETCSAGGKIGGAVTRDSGKLRETSRLGGSVQGPRNKGMLWYYKYNEDGSVTHKRSKVPLSDPWVRGRVRVKVTKAGSLDET